MAVLAFAADRVHRERIARIARVPGEIRVALLAQPRENSQLTEIKKLICYDIF
jgi:hypothetical protein